MLKWTSIFFVIAVAAAFFGYGHIEGPVANTARSLFMVFTCLAALAFFVLGAKSTKQDR